MIWSIRKKTMVPKRYRFDDCITSAGGQTLPVTGLMQRTIGCKRTRIFGESFGHAHGIRIASVCKGGEMSGFNFLPVSAREPA